MKSYVNVENLLIGLVEPYATGLVEDAAGAARDEAVLKRTHEFTQAVREVPMAGERLLAEFAVAFKQRRGWRRDGLGRVAAASRK